MLWILILETNKKGRETHSRVSKLTIETINYLLVKTLSKGPHLLAPRLVETPVGYILKCSISATFFRRTY